MARAVPIPEEQKQVVPIGELAIIAIPMEAYRKLSDLAMAQNMTVGQVLSKAIESLVGTPEQPRVLTEVKKGA